MTETATATAGRGPALGGGLAALLAVSACTMLDAASRPPLGEVATRMPAQIAGFSRGEPGQQQDHALTLDYATGNRAAVATVLIYDVGPRPLPRDPAAPEIERELTNAVTEVTEVPHGRTGRRLAESERFTIPDPGLRCALMEGAFGRAPVTRHVCLGVAEGRYVKVQVTMPAGRPAPADAAGFASGALRAARGA